MNNMIMVPFILPFFTALTQIAIPQRHKKWKHFLGLLSLLVLIGIEFYLLSQVWDGKILVSQMSNWPAPYGIVLLIDRLTAIMLLLTSITGFSALLYNLSDKESEHPLFQALYQFLIVGLNGAFLTADLFNLFVCYELMLISSYALLTLGNKRSQLGSGFHYISLNLLNSTLFLFALALLYGMMGTLNMADLSFKISRLPSDQMAWVQILSMVLLIVFAFKAALVPIFFWLPDTYPAPSFATATLFAGIMTKVGVYSILRVFTLVFGGGQSYAAKWILPLAGFTMLVGVLGAICQMNIRRLLSFHIISQVGYMVMGIGFFTPLGIAGGISYIIHHIMVKSSLFLCGGLTRKLSGSEDLRQMGGLMKYPFFTGLFFIAGLSLAGLPPFSGFFSKFLVMKAGFDAKEYGIVAVSIIAGILTLFSMMKIFTMAFWGENEKPIKKIKKPLLIATFILVSFSLTLSIFSETIFNLVKDAGEQVLNPDPYIKAVLTYKRL